MINIRYVNLHAMIRKYRLYQGNKLKITLSDGNMAVRFHRLEKKPMLNYKAQGLCVSLTYLLWAGQRSRYSDCATGWTVRASNTGGGKIYRTCPDRPWDPLSLLYNGYRVFPGGKERPGRDADPSPPSSAVVKEGQGYISTPPMGRTASTEPQCLYEGALFYCSLISRSNSDVHVTRRTGGIRHLQPQSKVALKCLSMFGSDDYVERTDMKSIRLCLKFCIPYFMKTGILNSVWFRKLNIWKSVYISACRTNTEIIYEFRVCKSAHHHTFK